MNYNVRPTWVHVGHDRILPARVEIVRLVHHLSAPSLLALLEESKPQIPSNGRADYAIDVCHAIVGLGGEGLRELEARIEQLSLLHI
mgnify:CR=1 FL=1